VPRPGRRAEAPVGGSSLAGTQLLVEKLIPEGNALGRLADGRVVIAQGAMPGDRIELLRVSQQKGLVRALEYRVTEPSSLRVTPRCLVVQECGGCDWMVLSREQQRASKLGMLCEALLRTGKIELDPGAIEFFADAAPGGYRSRVRLQVAEGRIGFHGRGSHVLVEPEQCAVSSGALNVALTELRGLARLHPSLLDAFVSVELRAAPDGTCSAYFERRNPARPLASTELAELRQHFRASPGGASLVATSQEEASSEALWQRFELTMDTYLLAPPGCFTQVNWQVNRMLIERVRGGARRRGVRSFLDAYAGCGNFALPLLALGLPGVAVEANSLAILAAREAARRQALPRNGFVCADSAVWARAEAVRSRRFDLVLLDPPRAGVKQGLSELAALASEWLVMCSCNPVTLARDLRLLLDRGFELDSVEAFDMFPETHHVETLAWLRAPQAQGRGGPAVT
jgi:23S rRNA (uracil1939-C5)-methyltransferase